MALNWEQITESYFKYVDRNHDGVISKNELKDFFDFAAKKGYKYDPVRFEAAFNQADKNKDGVFTKQELLQFLKSL